jgi:hypothetical protein
MGDVRVELMGASDEPFAIVLVWERRAVAHQQWAGLDEVAAGARRKLDAGADADLVVIDEDR